jgi:drug/metabolite transporter (DMT)-like permease
MSIDDRAERTLTIARPTTSTLLAWGLMTLLIIVVVLLFFFEIPKGNESTVNLVIGTLLGSFGTIVAYYFGDSKKAQAQADTINTLANKNS